MTENIESQTDAAPFPAPGTADTARSTGFHCHFKSNGKGHFKTNGNVKSYGNGNGNGNGNSNSNSNSNSNGIRSI